MSIDAQIEDGLVRLKSCRTKDDAVAVAERFMTLRRSAGLTDELRLIVEEAAKKAMTKGEQLQAAQAGAPVAVAPPPAPAPAPGEEEGILDAVGGAFKRMFSGKEPEPEPEIPPRNAPQRDAAAAAQRRQQQAAQRTRKAARPASAPAPAPRPAWNAGGGGAKPKPKPKPHRAAGGAPARGRTPPAGGAAKPGGAADKQKGEYIARIESEIVDSGPPVRFDDIAGLAEAKQTLQEMVIMPQLRPDLFTGLRAPPRGLLLFGPPGTGKTMLAKAVACEANATFFSISASSLTGRWVGESEGMVRAMFEVARSRQPAFIFIDEVDSLLSERGGGNEGEGSRKLKTEFLVQFDGVSSGDSQGVTVMGATNRPQEIDEAARRRFVKRIYVPLPDDAGRLQLLDSLMAKHRVKMSAKQRKAISQRTAHYSGADLRALCGDAAMAPIRELSPDQISGPNAVHASQVRPVKFEDLIGACDRTRPSVGAAQVAELEAWNREFGSFR